MKNEKHDHAGNLMAMMERVLSLLFGAIMALILLCVLFTFKQTQFACKRDFPLSQMAMLGVGALMMVAIFGGSYLMRRIGGKRAYWVYGLALFVMESTLCYFSYFLTGWDPNVIIRSAYALVGGADAWVDNYYYAIYPNNVTITVLFAAVMRLYRAIVGNAGLERCVYALLVTQCVLNALTGVLLCKTASYWKHSKMFTHAVALGYTAFVAISPWIDIPYSDSTGLIFPTTVLYCYTRIKEKPKRYGGIIFLMTGLGYLIKPQTAILSIAIVIIEGFGMLARKKWKNFAWLAASIVILTLCVSAIPSMLERALPFEERKGWAVTPVHYLMMGLNEEKCGGFNAEDLNFTMSVSENERVAAQFDVIKTRLQGMGFRGLAAHLHRKLLVNYADGLFAWGCEGEFYNERIADKDDIISPLIKSFMDMQYGANTWILCGWMQSLWLILLLGCAAAGLCAKKEECAFYAAILGVIGLTVFVMLFEARARYLFTFAPIYLLLGMLGLWTLAERFKNGKSGLNA